jgi:hypothetical protein
MALQLFFSAAIVKLLGTLGYGIGWLRFPAVRDVPFALSERFEGKDRPMQIHEVARSGPDYEEDTEDMEEEEGGRMEAFETDV